MGEPGGRIENLRPFKPGVVNNPTGRPKGRRSISTYLKMFVEGDVESLPNGKLKDMLKEQGFDTLAAAMAYKKSILALSSSIKPDTQLKAMDSIEDRLEGKSTQRTELTGKDGGALSLSDISDYEESIKEMTVEELQEHKRLLEQANDLIKKSQARKALSIDSASK